MPAIRRFRRYRGRNAYTKKTYLKRRFYPAKRMRRFTKYKRPAKRARTTAYVKKTMKNVFGMTPPTRTTILHYDKSSNFRPDLSSYNYWDFGTGYVFRVNSPYDPLYAATGTWNLTAVGHDVMARYYNKYRCYKSCWDVWIKQIEATSTAVDDVAIIARIDDDATWTTGSARYPAVGRQKNCKMARIHWGTEKTGKCHLRLWWHHTTSLNSPISADTAVNADPINPCYLMLKMFTVSGAVTANTIPYISVTVSGRMWVTYSDRKETPDADLDQTIE